MGWLSFLGVREEVRLTAIAAAKAVRRDATIEARAALAGWRFAGDPQCTDRVIEAVVQHPARPSAAELRALLGPHEALPASSERLRPWEHYAALVERLGAEDSEGDPLVWSFAVLGLLSGEVERMERQSWSMVPFRTDPAADEAIGRWWTAWFDGDLGPVFGDTTLQEQLRQCAVQVAGNIARIRSRPPASIRLLVEEAWLGWLIGPGGEGTVPGWAEVAARLVEAGPGGPAETLVAALPTRHRAAMAACAVRRGNGPRTAAWALPGPRRAEMRALAFSRLPVEAALDMHVVGRLLHHWAQGRTGAALAWRVVEQNRGRARARLRSLAADAAAGGDGGVRRAVLSLDALHARTIDAFRRYLRDRLWSEASRDFALGDRPGVDPPCVATDRGEDAIGADDPSLRTWVLLVLLKGRLERLIRWVQTGGTGDQDTRWGELLRHALPAALAGEASGPSRYGGLRSVLAEALPEILISLRPTLEAIAALDTVRTRLGARFEAAIDAEWDPSVPRPRVQYRRYVGHALQALGQLDALEVLL